MLAAAPLAYADCRGVASPWLRAVGKKMGVGSGYPPQPVWPMYGGPLRGLCMGLCAVAAGRPLRAACGGPLGGLFQGRYAANEPT